MSRILLAGLVALTTAAPAFAQTAGALGGAQVPGVCFLSQPAVLANTKVGVMFTARVKQLSDQAQAEINDEQAPIAAEAKAVDAAKLKPKDKAAKTEALTARVQVLQQKAQLRTREIEATRQKALARISAQEQLAIAEAYKAHGCGLLFDRGSVLGGNMGGDLTADVVKGLDARMPDIAFDREILPK